MAKILIVEDDERAVKSYKFKFSTRDEVSKVLVKYAVNAQEAMNIIKNDSPDLIYLDLSLGESTNPEGLEILKEYSKKFNIIVISGFSEYMDECLVLGAKWYITKPIDFIKMMQTGEDVLNLKTQIQQRT